MKREYNEVQKEAIYDLDSSIVLKAGAGAGKTMVLTSRLVEIIKEKKGRSRILAITFTKKASQEMRTRVQKMLQENGIKQEALDNCQIQTIDSFCSDLVKAYAIELGISPDFRVLEQGQSDRILGSIIRDRVRDIYKKEPLFQDLLEILDKNFSQTEKDIMDLYTLLRQNGHLEAFRAYDHKVPPEELNRVLEDTKEILLGLYGAFGNQGKKTKSNKLQDLLSHSRSQAILSGEMDRDALEALAREAFSKIGRIKYAQEFKEDLGANLLVLVKSKEERNKAYIDLIESLLRDINKDFWQEKRARAYMDFGDLLEQALRLCQIPQVGPSLQDLYDYIMVDEFQDTNEVQIALIEFLSKKAKLFIVGDKKQSIYGFRGASLEASIKASQRMENQGARVLSLEENYRTRPELMDYINQIFSNKMQDFQALRGNGKLNLGEFGLVDLREDALEKEDQIRKEATFIADKAQEFLDSGQSLSMGLLLRTKTNMQTYEEVFRQRGLPFINRSSKGFFETREIKDLLIILRHLYKPQDPLAYLGFLRSPFVGLSDGAIYLLFKNKREGLSQEDLEKEQRSQDICQGLEDLCKNKTVYDLIYKIFYELGFIVQVGQSQSGQQGIQNLLLFLDLSKDYDDNHARGLGGFLDFLEGKKLEDIPQADMPAGSNYLEITTIHKSKGLEYDIVFLGDLTSGKSSFSGKINFSKDLGAGINLENASYIYDRNTSLKASFEEEEDLRLFYVAMTRAKAGLYILISHPSKGGAKPGFLRFLDLDKFLEVQNTPPKGEGKGERESKEGSPSPRAIPRLEIQDEKPVLSPSSLLHDSLLESSFEPSSGSSQADIVGSQVHLYAAFAKQSNPSLKKEIVARSKKDLGKKDLDRLARLIDKYDLSLGEEVLATELPFLVEFKDFKLQGVIDQVRKIQGQTYLIDIKTGHSGVKTPAMEIYKKQIQLYGISWKKVYGYLPRLQLFFLEDGARVEVEAIEEEDFMAAYKGELYKNLVK